MVTFYAGLVYGNFVCLFLFFIIDRPLEPRKLEIVRVIGKKIVNCVNKKLGFF